MVHGFKDDKGNFRPTDRKIGTSTRVTDKSLQVGIDGSQIAQTIAKQTKDFAKRKALEQIEKLKTTKERQARELALRRDFEKRLISSFKRARQLQIKDPVLLKNQILIDVPEIKDNSENLKFIENILNGFIKREKQKDKAIKKVKTQEEKDLIEERFDKAELAEEADVKKQITKDESKLKKKQQEELEKLKAEKKAFKETKEEIETKAIDKFKEKEKVAKRTEEIREEIQKDEQDLADKIARDKERQEKEAKEPTVTFADLEKREQQEEKQQKENEKSMDELLKVQTETLDAIKKEEVEKEEAEEARDVAETLLGELESPFPMEII